MLNKRSLAWDYTNTKTGVPMDKINFEVIGSVSNWNTWVPPELKGRAPFRPMVRTEAHLSGGEWANIENSNQSIIHFFNEPNIENSDHPIISPEHAAHLWRQKMVPLRSKGKKLVSPSCSNDPNGQDWINEWMKLVSADPPDYLGLHYYGTDGNAMIDYLQAMHNRHKLPVIVSEWASLARDPKSVYAMTAQLCNFMDSPDQDWIFEYALFGAMRELPDDFVSPAAQLMKPDGSFTELFLKYQSEFPMRPLSA